MRVFATVENVILVRGWWRLLEYFSNGPSEVKPCGELLRVRDGISNDPKLLVELASLAQPRRYTYPYALF